MFFGRYEQSSRLWVVVPVQVLQVVGSQDVDVATAADAGVVDDALGIAALEQALQGLQPVTRLCSMFDEGRDVCLL